MRRIEALLILCTAITLHSLVSCESKVPPSCDLSSRLEIARSLPPLERVPTIVIWDLHRKLSNNWQGYLRHIEMYDEWFMKGRTDLTCPVRCNITHELSPSTLRAAEAIVWWNRYTWVQRQFEDIWGGPLDSRCPEQRWYYTATEAKEMNNWILRYPPGGIMHMEVSYRKFTPGVFWLNVYDNDFDIIHSLKQPPTIAVNATRENRGKQAAVGAWMSACHPPWRIDNMKEMQKYIAIDSFGSCAHNKDVPPHWTHGETDIYVGRANQKVSIMRQRYKFVISFENQRLNDWVTEKFFAPILIGILPIYDGAPNIDLYNPAPKYVKKKPYLLVSDYPNLKALAEYIDYLDRNDTAYLEHMEFRNHFDDINPIWKNELDQHGYFYHPCKLCQHVHHHFYGTPIANLTRQHILPLHLRNPVKDKEEL